MISCNLTDYQSVVDNAVEQMRDEQVVDRIFDHDHTVWKPEPDEITNRLGWLESPERMSGQVDELVEFSDEVKDAGFTHVLLLGMGGSSLAPELYARTFRSATGLELQVLDSTVPGSVLSYRNQLNPERTLFIVASKSGGTVETLSFFKYFYAWIDDGRSDPGAQFVAITDSGSNLEKLGKKLGFRRVFLANPDVGGRYSALTHFGLVPAILSGVNIEKLLSRARNELAEIKTDPEKVLRFGAILGELALLGRDKLTLIIEPELASLGDWIEQLVAESTGKNGTGILPVVHELVGRSGVYGDDRLFVSIGQDDAESDQSAIEELHGVGHPVVTITLEDLYDLGSQFVFWQFATALAGARMNINPFNQPNVESAKVRANELLETYTESGSLPEEDPVVREHRIVGYGDHEADSLRSFIDGFIDKREAHAYIAVHAYLEPEPEIDSRLENLRVALRKTTGLVVTVGYGPRFLHSTGQLYKGDGGNGLFIQLTADDSQDIEIPDEPGGHTSSITFGILKEAQVRGDYQALKDAGREVIRLHLSDAPADKIGVITELLQ